MITGLYMGWTDPLSKKWFPIKKMTWDDNKYYTVYLQGMLSAIATNPSKGTAVKVGLIKLDRIETTEDIEVSFKTRMPVNRPFDDIERLDRLGLPTDLTQFDPFEYIARSGGESGADTSDIFPEVTPDRNGIYHYYFRIGAIEGLDISEYIRQLQIGNMLIIQEGRIYHDGYLLGETPGYIKYLSERHGSSFNLTIAKINHDIYQFGKILCHATVDSKNHIPFRDDDYQPLIDNFFPNCS
jgi:hypothetical protein